MQVSRFPDGGYVVHGITGSFKGRVSAWFGPTGTLLDAEQKILGVHSCTSGSRPVRVDGPIWEHCKHVGKRIFDTQINVVGPAVCSARFDRA
jgi:hypothetical protein